MTSRKIRIAAAGLALAMSALCTPLAFAATDVKAYAAIPYAQAASQPAGQQLTITGTPNYNAVTSNETTTFFGFDTADGTWYVSVAKSSFEAFKAAAPAQQMTLYGTYAGTLEANSLPILSIQSGAAKIGDKTNEVPDLYAAGQKTLDAQKKSATSTGSASQKTGQMVWIPTNGGKKYHSKSTCSNMENPKQVDRADAEAQGFTACKKCY